MPLSRLLVLAAFAGLALVDASAQGTLVPPSQPAPSLRSLDEIEARTPLGQVGGQNGTVTINQPGSYVLVGPVIVDKGRDGIAINCNNVTLDLNGFTVESVSNPAAGNGIAFPVGADNIIIRNGRIRGQVVVSGAAHTGFGFRNGIYSAGIVQHAIVTDVVVSSIDGYGFYLDGCSTIERCTAADCGNTGIRGQVIVSCSANNCARAGIEAAIVRNCTASCHSGTGISTSAASGSTGTSSQGTGIESTLASNCSGSSATGPGLLAQNAANCSGTTNSSTHAALTATGTASFCRGDNAGASGVAIKAGTSIGCTATRGTLESAHAHLQ